jgi:biotin operon repressor
MAKRTTARRQKPLLPSERVRRGPDAARRANQTERLARALRLLELLCGLKCHTLDGLAQELNCSTKTVRRCLHVLRAAGYEWRFDKYRKGYELISSPQFRLPITQLSNEELLGQVVAGILSSAPGLDLAAGARRTTQKLCVFTHTGFAWSSRPGISSRGRQTATACGPTGLPVSSRSK